MLLQEAIDLVESKSSDLLIANESKYHREYRLQEITTFAEQVIIYCTDRNIKSGTDFSICTFLDKNIYYRLKSDRNYIPEEKIAYSICFGLQLTFAEATYLLNKARMNMIPSTPNDMYRELLVQMLITGKTYIPECNKELEALGFQLLGSFSKNGKLVSHNIKNK